MKKGQMPYFPSSHTNTSRKDLYIGTILAHSKEDPNKAEDIFKWQFTLLD